MVNFRRVVTALAVLALFTGMAFAQQESCSAQGTVSTPLRSEGFTEMSGDIIITCTGGTQLQLNANIPLVNFTVYYNTTVTSRLVGNANAAGQTPSEALLIIDEPGTNPQGLPVGTGSNTVQYGQTQALNPCVTSYSGCPDTAGPIVNGYTTATIGKNVYQGLVSGNSVTFYGVPALPPSTVGSRVYRITNVRVDATKGGAATGTTPVQAYINVSGASSLPISNSQPIVGYISPSLQGKVTGSKAFKQCQSVTTATTTTTQLAFTELFGSAFKTRVVALTDVTGAGQVQNLTGQQTPGGIYNSESNFIYTNPFTDGAQTSSAKLGLADFGTRLKATFNNVPSGVHVYVDNSSIGTAPSPVGGKSIVPYAVAITGGEGSSDGTGFTPVASTGNTEVTIVNGTGTAVWEVVNTNPNTVESLAFGVYISYTAATATNSPLPGTASVTLSYAPTATSGAASKTLPIPRFTSGSFTGTVFTINVCRTLLLYPYITNQAGFDTGLTVANTSQDPFFSGDSTTAAQNGTCTFTYYGGTTAAPTTPPAATTTPNIAGGTVWANTLGTIAPNFQGYAFAICNFQYAHGFAFISDVGARNLAMGYLAVVLTDGRSNTNTTTAENGGH
jgi:hypothetical protein